jgi:carbon-monoxide dehydrogenase large subunit
MGARHFGARVARLEDPALLTGRGRFVDDIRLAGALHACFVRSPYSHAKVRTIDATAARAMRGVHAVLTVDDLPARMARSQIPMLVPNPSIATPRTQLALARREVCYVGQTIAVAIADNRYLAEDAAAAVDVDFEFCPRSATAARRRRPMRRLYIAISRPMSPLSSP